MLQAVELEATLLLEYRPPFNRTGVWQGEPWWLAMEVRGEVLGLELTREPRGLGPLPSGFRHALGSLVRCAYRCLHPKLPLSSYPMGLFRPQVPLQMNLPLPEVEIEKTVAMIREYAGGGMAAVLTCLQNLPPSLLPLEQAYWEEEIKGLERFAEKRLKMLAL